MAELKQTEKLLLESLFEMRSGYVMQFSNSSFAQFFQNNFKIDIYNPKYAKYGDSKANRLRAFWDIEGNVSVAKLINELLEVWQTNKLLANSNQTSGEKQIFTQCQDSAKRLLGYKPPIEGTSTDDFLHKEFSDVSIRKLKIDGLIFDILEDRIKEINKNIKSGAALSVIIMCGSVLEGILLGVALAKPKDFNSCLISPKEKTTGKVLPFNAWNLSNLIDVCHNLGLLGLDVKKHSHSLRDFRNFVHPYEQLSHNFTPDIDTAKISWQVLKAAITDLSKNI